ncbi:MAG TPA: flagellar biosynthesis anti-sigma factor FlgM [Novosphingobium sp.]|nr:flagellar biosynthesis anti-sigma factor FlgM [Novosphingobium sp.]
MSSIGSGPGIGSGSNISVSARLASTAESQSAQTVTANGASDASAAGQTTAMVSTAVTGAGNAPVDTDRVASIRKAISTGNYPLIPTKIGDAMIKAGLMLRGAG